MSKEIVFLIKMEDDGNLMWVSQRGVGGKWKGLESNKE